MKNKPLGVFLIFSRQNSLPDDDRFVESLDARHVLQEREDRQVPQHPPGQFIRAGISRRRRSLQHQSVADLRLFHAPAIVSFGQTNLQSGRGQL